MGTLRKLKTKMKFDRDWHKTLLRSGKDEILIDIDGDKEADLALLDTTGDGDIDTLAVDLTGDGEFNLYFGDTDQNGIPDVVLYDENGTGSLELLGLGKEVEDAIVSTACMIRAAVITGDYIADALEQELDELQREIKAAQKELKKANRR